jgi:DNA topoisomerase-2
MLQTRVKDFLSGPVRDFSLYDCHRSLPSIVDGFKPSQRKVVFGLLKKGENSGEIKVAQLASHVAAVSSYHHGEASLESTIVGLAQDFAGSNNINFLSPEGQFGSRLSPEASAGRYIHTFFTPDFRKIFKKEDDIILNHLEDDGMRIEPDYYLPIIPTLLVNGSRGMGTGFACNILGYNPRDIQKYILNVLKGKKQNVSLIPWYRNFNGLIDKTDEGQTIFVGELKVVNTTTIEITELPIGTYLDDYKEYLNKLEDAEVIKGYDDHSTEEAFKFIVTCPRTTTYLNEDNLYKKFKLISRETENFTVWLPNGKLKKFETAEELCDYFITFRLGKYEERRQKLLQLYSEQLDWLNEKLRFINYYIKNSESFSKKKKDDLRKMLTDLKFKNIDDLLDIKIYNLTLEQIEKLKEEIEKVKKLIQDLKNITNKEMYIKELEELKL